MADDNKYQPINCNIHDGYELACIRGAIHEITWSDNGQTLTAKLRFLDLEYSKDGEYLIAENTHRDTLKIRLDSISSTLPY